MLFKDVEVEFDCSAFNSVRPVVLGQEEEIVSIVNLQRDVYYGLCIIYVKVGAFNWLCFI